MKLEVYSQKDVFEQLLRRIDSLACIESERGTLPYIRGKDKAPFNVVTGREVSDMNRINLELSAAMTGETGAAFLTGVNAALIGLEADGYGGEDADGQGLREYTETGVLDESTFGLLALERTRPVLVMYNVATPGGGTRPEYEYAYFVGQFSAASLGKSADRLKSVIRGGGKKERQTHTVLRNALGNLCDYDRGVDADTAEEERQNLIRNSDTRTEEYRRASALHKFYAGGKPRSEAEVFECLRKFYVNQRQLADIMAPYDRHPAAEIVRAVAEPRQGRFAFCAFEALAFAARTASPSLRVERYLSPPVSMPKAMTLSPERILAEVERQAAEKKRRDAKGVRTGQAKGGRDRYDGRGRN